VNDVPHVKIVIIGNSATAVGAIESIRQHDQRAEIVVVTQESSLIYSRPMLSHYLAGEIEEERLCYRGGDFYTEHGVKAILDSEVLAIEPQEHHIRTRSGEAIWYDKLLICTGGVPIVPPIAGLDPSTPGVFTFTTLADASGVIEYMRRAGQRPAPQDASDDGDQNRGDQNRGDQIGDIREAVVVGGGMIGIKATDALVSRGLHVTMVELAPRILSAGFDEIASDMVSRIFMQGGVDVLTENTVTAVHTESGSETRALGGHVSAVHTKSGSETRAPGGRISAVTLQDGRTLRCDLLILGIGVRPNARIAEEAGLDVRRGIVVDEYMRTSAPDIYAAGDVAEAYDLVVDMNRTVAIWPNAYRQGAIAGAHMVGVARADQGGVAMNTIEALGVPAMAIGNANAPEGEGYQVLSELHERGDKIARTYRRLVIKDGLLVGAILVGNIERAGIYTGLIRNKIPIDDVLTGPRRQNLMNINLLSLPDTYRKHVVTGAGIEV
jgi:nitrite reductase (NADH) large subunit